MDQPHAPLDPQDGSSPDSWVVKGDAKNFESIVLRGSNEQPVIVDFWAPWCEPCKTLGPALEKAAREGAGRFRLVTVDVDKNPELAQAFGVQSIPAVFAVSGGRMVDGFQGALPPAELEKFLERVAPGGSRDPLSVLRERASGGDLAGAIDEVRALVDDPLHGVPARALLGELLMESGDLAGARAEFEFLSAQDLPAEVQEAVVRALRGLEHAESAGDLQDLQRAVQTDPDDAGAQLALGRALVAKRDYQPGLEALLESVRIDPTLEEGAAKQAMLDTFEVLGLEDPIANEFRFQLSLEILA